MTEFSPKPVPQGLFTILEGGYMTYIGIGHRLIWVERYMYLSNIAKQIIQSSMEIEVFLQSPSVLLRYKDHQEEQTGTIHEDQLQQYKDDDTRLALTHHEGSCLENLAPSLLLKKV